MKRILYLFICLFPIIGCNNTSESSKVAVKIDGGTLTLEADSTKTQTLQISIGQAASFYTSLKGGEELNILDSLRSTLLQYDLAYELAQNQGHMSAYVSIPNKLDTLLQCQFKYGDIWGSKGEIITGKAAKIVSTFDSEYIDSELRRWVYKNKKNNIGEKMFNDMRLYLKELSSAKNTEFVLKGSVPSITSTQLSKISYKVNSDMVADNYYLFVCDEDEDIDIFIEEMIARNLADATKSLSSSMYCWKQGDTNGTQCIFLIGINNDWSVQVIPIGVISVDNIAPNYGMSKNTFNESYTKLDFSKRGFTIDVSDHPNISGWWDVSYGSFQGWNIPYIISWSGDVSKVIIYGTKSSPKTIELDGKSSPYHISIYTSLIIGDNYIKLEAIDKLGNKSTQEINIATVAVDNDKTHIDIDNNIWN